MQNPMNNGCKPNEHYTKTMAARMLGVSRPTLDNYIQKGWIRMIMHRATHALRIKGTELIRYYNSIS